MLLNVSKWVALKNGPTQISLSPFFPKTVTYLVNIIYINNHKLNHSSWQKYSVFKSFFFLVICRIYIYRIYSYISLIWECPLRTCRKRRSIRAGSFFEDSKISLGQWLNIIYLCSIDVSNKQLSLMTGISLRTIAATLAKIRQICSLKILHGNTHMKTAIPRRHSRAW